MTGKFPFALALLTVVLLIFGVMAIIILIIWGAVTELSDNQELYKAQFDLLLENVADYATRSGFNTTTEELVAAVDGFHWGEVATEAAHYTWETAAFFGEVLLFLMYILLARNPKYDFVGGKLIKNLEDPNSKPTKCEKTSRRTS